MTILSLCVWRGLVSCLLCVRSVCTVCLCVCTWYFSSSSVQQRYERYVTLSFRENSSVTSILLKIYQVVIVSLFSSSFAHTRTRAHKHTHTHIYTLSLYIYLLFNVRVKIYSLKRFSRRKINIPERKRKHFRNHSTATFVRVFVHGKEKLQ